MSSNSPTRQHVKHRQTARAIVQDTDGRVLLMLTHWDPGTGLPPRWLTPGGGIDQGETVEAALVREIFEETGIALDPNAVGECIGTIDFEMDWSESRFETGSAHFFHIKVETEIELKTDFWTQSEWRDIIEVRWWSLQEIQLSNERFGPPGLRAFLSENLAS